MIIIFLEENRDKIKLINLFEEDGLTVPRIAEVCEEILKYGQMQVEEISDFNQRHIDYLLYQATNFGYYVAIHNDHKNHDVINLAL